MDEFNTNQLQTEDEEREKKNIPAKREQKDKDSLKRRLPPKARQREKVATQAEAER